MCAAAVAPARPVPVIVTLAPESGGTYAPTIGVKLVIVAPSADATEAIATTVTLAIAIGSLERSREYIEYPFLGVASTLSGVEARADSRA